MIERGLCYFFDGKVVPGFVLPPGKTAAAGRLKRSAIPPAVSVLSWLARLQKAVRGTEAACVLCCEGTVTRERTAAELPTPFFPRIVQPNW